MSDTRERERLAAWLKADEKPEIAIDCEAATEPLPVGASKLGSLLDVPPDLPPTLAGLADKESRCEVMDADVEAVRRFVAEHALRG